MAIGESKAIFAVSREGGRSKLAASQVSIAASEAAAFVCDLISARFTVSVVPGIVTRLCSFACAQSVEAVTARISQTHIR